MPRRRTIAVHPMETSGQLIRRYDLFSRCYTQMLLSAVQSEFRLDPAKGMRE
jgi:hypothetical protein